jgi:hypothetical protein
MRQGGLRPHNHNSGVYWVRATGGKEKNKSEKQPRKKLSNIVKLFYMLVLLSYYFFIIITIPDIFFVVVITFWFILSMTISWEIL